MKAFSKSWSKTIRFFISLLVLSLCASEARAQVDAGFSASDTAGCTSFEVQFWNEGSSGGTYSYLWWLTTDGAITSTDEDPSFTYHSPGNYVVTQIVTNTSTLETDTARLTIVVHLTPPASLTIDTSNACPHGEVSFNTSYSSKDSIHWIFGDGNQTVTYLSNNYMSHIYDAPGSYNLQCITYYSDQLCSQTRSYTINVDGPEAELLIDPNDACKGDDIEFTINVINDVSDFYWEFGDGSTSTNNPAIQVFDTIGEITASLFLTGVTDECMIQETFYLHEVVADFSFGPACTNESMQFSNLSQGNDINLWDFSNGEPTPAPSPNFTFSEEGDYPVKLVVSDIDGCKDSITKLVTVTPLPTVITDGDITICPGIGGTLSVSSSSPDFSVRWRPSWGLEEGSSTSLTPLAIPEYDTVYEVTVTDALTGCINTAQVRVSLQDVFETGYITMSVNDSSIIIGDTISFNYEDELNRELNYSWTPDLYLIGCNDCPTPKAQPLESMIYELEVSDENECAVSEIFSFAIEVTEEYKLGLPQAFTPNGDNINETIKVEGWGIKAIQEFRIYNRNGRLVFFGDHLSAEWDGTFENKEQPVGSYQFYVKAEMWDGNITEKRGTFTLLR